jgi:pyruvate kinase
MAQSVPLRTKFICTLGPATSDKATMAALARAGATMFRNNFAHVTYAEYQERLRLVQEINRELGTNVQMQADLQGPNIRIGELPEAGVPLEAGKTYWFYTAGGDPAEGRDIFINDETLHLDVKAGEPITFMDGALEGEVTAVAGHRLAVLMTNGGVLESRKSVNVPETTLTCSILTPKDREDLRFLLETGVDWIALSFICSRDEIEEVRRLIGERPVKIISKIERREALRNLHQIIEASDALMIARGDLGIELPMEKLPILQKQIINLCEYSHKPVIMATQMLLSMVKSKRPTRAEVSDVANAVFDRVDALMLSEETSKGVDPVNALRTMVSIVEEAESHLYHRQNAFDLVS